MFGYGNGKKVMVSSTNYQRLFVAVFCIAYMHLVIGCTVSVADNNNIAFRKEMLIKTHEDFTATVKTFPYRASEDRRRRIIQNCPKTKIGMTQEQILALLGEPDVATEIWGKTKQQGFHGWGWQYYLYKEASFSENLNHDQSLFVFYSPDGKVDDISKRGRWSTGEL